MRIPGGPPGYETLVDSVVSADRQTLPAGSERIRLHVPRLKKRDRSHDLATTVAVADLGSASDARRSGVIRVRRAERLRRNRATPPRIPLMHFGLARIDAQLR